ncbi:tryptophan synthase subunit alpha [Candidatus Methylacidithermus pantelleriae]|uniref:Tryptophan synthase alpha chain n=1 Tax=Candidatus Methylacidithermus pantelleriae TaxID=2744239 RepID=A0A8J2FMI5_9BACT|nr:tryptophan synthase subunit alpha [Candidatus Methylacidithermus pantelleriae]CAF0688902.1 Tryptophan synthase alpha chain [Candidatus Methylacidithermus pantelleriae]
MRNRLDLLAEHLRSTGKKAFVAYLTAGDPSLSLTKELVLALAGCGTDLVELGVPFSDPMADGIVNQLSSQRALQAGTTLPKILELVADLREQCSVPLVLFTYLNPIFRFGLERFGKEALQCGVDAVLVVDLPPDASWEWAPWQAIVPRILLVAPTTSSERRRAIARKAQGFLYYVSREGVTGMREDLPRSLATELRELKEIASVPVFCGFGISKPEQARKVAEAADGVVVGSALVHTIGELGSSPQLVQEVTRQAQTFAEAVHSLP